MRQNERANEGADVQAGKQASKHCCGATAMPGWGFSARVIMQRQPQDCETPRATQQLWSGWWEDGTDMWPGSTSRDGDGGCRQAFALHARRSAGRTRSRYVLSYIVVASHCGRCGWAAGANGSNAQLKGLRYPVTTIQPFPETGRGGRTAERELKPVGVLRPGKL